MGDHARWLNKEGFSGSDQVSRQWYLKLSDLTKEQLRDWLKQKPYCGNEHDGSFDLGSGSARAWISELKPYQKQASIENWGIAALVEIGFNPCRNDAPDNSQTVLYRVAFDALADLSGDLVFHVLDVGILLRRNGRVIVNSEAFQLHELNCMLEPPFWLSSWPCHLLKRE